MDDSYSSTVKSIGAIILTLVLFLGVGYYVYTSLFVPPGPAQTEDVTATNASTQPVQTADEKKPS
jgi:hypothetical protein